MNKDARGQCMKCMAGCMKLSGRRVVTKRYLPIYSFSYQAFHMFHLCIFYIYLLPCVHYNKDRW